MASLFGEERPTAEVSELTAAASLDCGDLGTSEGALLLIRNGVDRLEEGSLLEVRSTNLELERELPSWLRLHGHALVAILDGQTDRRFLIRSGSAGGWKANPDWAIAPPPAHNGGKELADWLVGRAGDVPEVAATYFGFTPRGAVPETAAPTYPFTLNRREDVWADNLSGLYEQAKTQQWNAAQDIPWPELPRLPDDLERSVCQLMTFLAENEYAALYIPAKFLPQINAQYTEAILFLAGVINDEARHIEAFTRRALANGGGLQYSSALTERSLLGLLVQEDYFRSTFLLHVLGEGTFLDLLEFIEANAPERVTADVVRRARLDEGRHVAYGLAHVRACLEARPSRKEELVAAAEERAAMLETADSTNSFVREALAVIAGGGSRPEQLRRGFRAARQLDDDMHASRVRRMQQIGLDRATAEKISQIHTPNFM